MRELGREAIWFEYTTVPEASAELSAFDAVLVDGVADQFPALASVKPGKLLSENFAGTGAISETPGAEPKIVISLPYFPSPPTISEYGRVCVGVGEREHEYTTSEQPGPSC